MEIENLNKADLLTLKDKIEKRITQIETKSFKPSSDTILGLNAGDKILGMRLYLGGHSLVEPNEINGGVDVIDYCIVDYLSSDSKTIRMSISHPKGGFGDTFTLYIDKILPNEHCLLFMDTHKNGYNSFYTLKPETWIDDFRRLYNNLMKKIELLHKNELEIYNTKFQLFLDSKDKINSYI